MRYSMGINAVVFALLLSAFAALPAAGQSAWIESMNVVRSGNTVDAQVNISMSFDITETIGLSVWQIISGGWSELVAGPSFSPREWISVSVGAGFESAPNPWRTQVSLWMGDSEKSLLLVGEKGGGGTWYLVEGNYQITDGTGPNWALPTGVGFRLQRFVGIGPKLEAEVLPGLKLWFIPFAFDIEGNGGGHGNGIFSLRLDTP